MVLVSRNERRPDRITADEASHALRELLQKQQDLPIGKAFLLHDLGRMKDRIRRLKELFPATALHAVAMKANPLIEILRPIVEGECGLEAASIEEVHLALAAGCVPGRIVFDSPVKTAEELHEALSLGVILNANGIAELERIDQCRRSISTESMVGLRINPEVGSGSIASTSVARPGSKFGVSLGQHRQWIIDAFEKYPWLTGLHAHVGSQGCGTEMLVKSAQVLCELSIQIENATGRRVSLIDIGGGLPVAYSETSEAVLLETYVQQLRSEAPRLFETGTQLVTEFGRYLQARCGLAYSRVEYADSDRCFIHFGADLLLRPVYRPDEWTHEFFVMDSDGELKTSPTKEIEIVGPLCFAGDIVAQGVSLPLIEPGDWLAIRDVGAYTLSMWSRHCSRSLPRVIGFDSEATRPFTILHPGETAKDVIQFWSGEGVATNRKGI